MAQKMLSGMAAGINWRWKNLVYFEFTDCSIDSKVMVEKLLELIGELQAIGLDVKTLVGDMGILQSI